MTTVFKLGIIGVPRFEVAPSIIDFKEMAENTPSKTEEILYLSATVPQRELAPPKCTEPASEPFLKFSTPQPLSEFELAALVAKRSRPNAAVRISGGYRVMVTLHRKNPDPKPGAPPELDIGPLEKSFTVFGDTDSENQRINVKGNVTGLVALVDVGMFDLGSFSSREGIAKTFSLRSDRLDLELEIAAELTEPKVLLMDLGSPKNEEGRRYWTFKIKVAPGATTGELPGDSVVVLRAKGTGQLVRLPIKGRAFLR